MWWDGFGRGRDCLNRLSFELSSWLSNGVLNNWGILLLRARRGIRRVSDTGWWSFRVLVVVVVVVVGCEDSEAGG